MQADYCGACGRRLPEGTATCCRPNVGPIPAVTWADLTADDQALITVLIEKFEGVALERTLLTRLAWSMERLHRLPVGHVHQRDEGRLPVWRETVGRQYRYFVTDRARDAYAGRANPQQEDTLGSN